MVRSVLIIYPIKSIISEDDKKSLTIIWKVIDPQLLNFKTPVTTQIVFQIVFSLPS